MNTIYRINVEMQRRKQAKEHAEKRPWLYVTILSVILAGLLIAGACNACEDPKSVPAYQPPEGQHWRYDGCYWNIATDEQEPGPEKPPHV